MGRVANASTSKDEQYIYYYIKKAFPTAINRYVVQSQAGKRYEADIFIPDINVAIEYDGVYWHKDKYDQDVEKTAFFNSIGVYIIHVRETGLEALPSFYGLELWHRIGRGKKGLHTNEYISLILQNLSRFCDGLLAKELASFSLTYDQFCLDLPDINSLVYTNRVSTAVSTFEEFKYWDYEKNRALNPDNVPFDANIKVFLKCPAGYSKHINVSFVCRSASRQWFPLRSIGGICPFLGRHEICEDGCEYNKQKTVEFINRFVEGNEKLQNLIWLRRYAFNNDQVLSQAFKMLVDGSMSTEQFGELFLDGNYLLNAGLPIRICTKETLSLLTMAQQKYIMFDARIDPTCFDIDDCSRNELIKYLDFMFEARDPQWRGTYLNEIFCIAVQKKQMLSDELKQKIEILLKKYRVQGIPASLKDWLQ